MDALAGAASHAHNAILSSFFMLAVIETHPIQYRGPLYRMLQRDFGVPVTAIYGSDFSVAGYRDRDFAADLSWDVDLLSGYESVFLSRVADGGARSMEEVRSDGLRAALNRVKPKAVLITGYSPRYHQSAFFHAWRLGQPILFRGETTDMTTGSAVRSIALRLMYRRCGRILYIGESAKRHYAGHGVVSSKLIFSPYFVNTEPFTRSGPRELIREKFGIPADRKVILFSGKLTDIKRPDLLVEAVRDLPVSVIFLGDGPLRAKVESMGGDTHFAGFQNQTQISPYFHAADLFCLPSMWDTWGLVVNEALFHGLPCVVSDRVGCAADLITSGVTGEIFPHGDAAALRAAIERLLPRTGDPKIARACQDRESQYTMSRAAAGIAEAYRAVTS